MAAVAKPTHWLTKEREKVAIVDMRDTHLINALHHVRHVRSRVEAYNDVFEEEIKRRGLSEHALGVAVTLEASAKRRTWFWAASRRKRTEG